MHLVFDTETTGLPKNKRAPMTDIDNWGRVIQLAWAMYNLEGEQISKQCHMIYPDGWKVPREKFWLENNLTQERCIKEGIPMTEALDLMLEDINKSTIMIAHNLEFDYNTLGAEFIRYKKKAGRTPVKICTMTNGAEFMGKSSKYVKLDTLHRHIFGESFSGAHDALVDVEACARVFYAMLKGNHFTKQAQMFNE